MSQRGFLERVPRERRNTQLTTSRSHADSHRTSSRSHADSHPNPIPSRSHQSYSSRSQHSHYSSPSGSHDVEVQSEARDRRFNAPPPGGDPGGDPVGGAVDDEERRRQEFFENLIKAGLTLVFAVFGGLFALSESQTEIKGGKETLNYLYAANGFALIFLYGALMVGRRNKCARLLMIVGGLFCIVVVGVATSQYFNLDSENRKIYVGCLTAVYVLFVIMSFMYGELKLGP